MIETPLAILTGMGLSAAAGLNAYIPFMIVALIARFTNIITLPQEFAWIESTWALAAGAILLLAEVVLDKVAVVDHINDAVGTFVRPMTGGLIFAATQAASGLEKSSWMADHPWVGILAGITVAGLVHAGKAATRPVVNTTTAGIGTPVVSTVEDGAAVTLSLVAIFMPILVVIALALLLWGFWSLFRLIARRKRAREGYAY